MGDLIDRDALMKKICGNECGCVCDEECENAICNFYDYIMDAPAVNDWIPCSERFPEKHGEYMVFFGMYNYTLNGTDVIDKRYYGEKSDGTIGWHSLCSSEITHWMPLPDPPKEGADNG